MTDPLPLTVAHVQRFGGWNLAYARILALGSADGYGMSIVDGNGDERECYTDYWRWISEGWAQQAGIGGGFHPEGVCEWSDSLVEFRAAYSYCDDDSDQLDPGASVVGAVTITVTRVPATLRSLISDFLERVPVSSTADIDSLANGLDLALLLVESDEPALGLRELVDWLAEHGVALTPNELADLARLAEEHCLFDDEWGRLEAQVVDGKSD
jgi:hypothetical protein